ncbi:Zn-dependent hydrolase [Paracoccus saliphilus]|uniref:Allantoate deiminase n=1 Tax=Paracoccus saliphilus TaxID=405559 RepID=A0AA45W7I6_9RHOB|nr:Zn-dependent hydrolase [Paracoccus saliphilus]WCR03046.1 Zn-dependent hydrolase [Paracoccus saliphilus]SIT10129.1 allantoate deiminase [Paracoccus saliphilus]
MTRIARTERIQGLIEGLDRFTATPGNGTTRLTYSPEFRQARDYLRDQMAKAGLVVREDAVGNIFGRLEGRDPGLAPIIVGSHFDSVPNGGKFDGPAGVITGIEIAFLFQEQGLVPNRPIEFIAMIEEEGARFGGGLFGSRILTGKVDTDGLSDLRDDDGISVAEAMREYGLDPENAGLAVLPPGAIHAFLELHIEQGPVLETHGEDVAIVDRIVGLSQLKVTIRGQAGHAGTTPMNARRDALVGAVSVLSELPDLARSIGQDAVLTVGKIDVLPGGANVIPDQVTFSVDIRAPKEEVVRELISQTQAVVEKANGNGLTSEVELQLFAQPTLLSSEIHGALSRHADELGLKSRVMVSGAGHDAMIMADFAPTGLIFVPSHNGISHAPEEWTDFDQLARGIDVMFRTVKEMAG